MLQNNLENPIFPIVSRLARDLGVEAYVIGGYVRDFFLQRTLTDIDITVVGDGVALAKALGRELKTNVTVYKNFGTAALRYEGCEIEFVGARRESYSRDSRKPRVEIGTLSDDQRRRDFTINAMAFSLNEGSYGALLDPFEGILDLERKIIRTPLDPDTTFSDDPLRMMRAVRFATQLGFDLDPVTQESIIRNAPRLEIISAERILTELNKIMASGDPARGWRMLDQCALLKEFLPELVNLKGVDRVEGKAHKDNFVHTLQVLENITPHTDKLYLRWAALFHDIAKPQTKKFEQKQGWTFHGHEVLGSKMMPRIFRRLKLPMDERLKYVQKLIFLHLRPIILSQEIVTDSAVRRMLFEAGDDIDDLMTLCEADITSGDGKKVERYLRNFALVRQKLVDIEEKDRLRNFQPPIDGSLIMRTYGLEPCNTIGELKTIIKDAILDGQIPNEFDAAFALLEQLAAERGLKKVE
ncbi:MAG: HD domain-containing protein [Rikenellaceae bacterium]